MQFNLKWIGCEYEWRCTMCASDWVNSLYATGTIQWKRWFRFQNIRSQLLLLWEQPWVWTFITSHHTAKRTIQQAIFSVLFSLRWCSMIKLLIKIVSILKGLNEITLILLSLLRCWRSWYCFVAGKVADTSYIDIYIWIWIMRPNEWANRMEKAN